MTAYVEKNRTDLDAAFGWGKQGAMMAYLRGLPSLRWAAPLDIKKQVETVLQSNYGDRTAAMNKARAAEKAARDAAKNDDRKSKASAANAHAHNTNAAAAHDGDQVEAGALARPEAMFETGFLSRLHKPGGNPQTREELKNKHLLATGGRVVTRFPPEPNGFLHIGHVKAISVDFGYARVHKGLTYLRYDDTNPEAEEEVYFKAILENVRWLGFEPFTVTYSSDYFERLYELAVNLIKRGGAYVDHSTGEEIKAERGGEAKGPRHESKWRNRPIEENLAEFAKMKEGKYQPGEATLRMKQDILGNGNPQMWDLVAYRVLAATHHRTGSKWCIYPTYDFTHCLVDSFENISHSLCTTEFQLARESYEWLCDAVDVYKPRQYEFGRLSLEGTLTSKRKLNKVIQSGLVKDWDDPRLYTVIALRRRGVPPEALLEFVSGLGVSTSPALVTIDRFEWAVRAHLEAVVPRLMLVLEPLKVVVTDEDIPDDWTHEVTKPLHPKVPAMGQAKAVVGKTLYIDASDFRTEDQPGYFRLAPGKTVGILNAPYPITAERYDTDPTTGKPSVVYAKFDKSGKKPKAFIQWVSGVPGEAVHISETRTFSRLFNSANPGGEPDILSSVNRDSLTVHKGAMVERAFWTVAGRAMAAARTHAVERTKQATALAEEARKQTGLLELLPPGAGRGAPEPSADQLVGNEVVRFQAMRIGYFTFDREAILPSDMGAVADKGLSDEEGKQTKLILNRIVGLKEDSVKAMVK